MRKVLERHSPRPKAASARITGGNGDWESDQDTLVLVLYSTELSAAFICRASSRADPVPLMSITHISTAELPLGILLWISPLSPRALWTEPLKIQSKAAHLAERLM